MSKLWVFADSYGVHIEQKPEATNKWFWAYELAKKLKCDYYHNYSQMGVSNDYIQYMIMEREKEISPDDYVIVISTSLMRKWFIKDKPWVGNFYVNNVQQNTSIEFASAVRHYITHLYNEEAEKINFHQFLGWLHYTSDKHRWNMLVITGFEEQGYPISHRYQVIGSLFDICKNEFSTQEDLKWFYDVHGKGRDKRSGHLLRMNHEILCQKIFDTYTDNLPLDLNQGFNKNIISRNNINELVDQFPELDLSSTTVKGFIPKL
jgi:hypothetical protein